MKNTSSTDETGIDKAIGIAGSQVRLAALIGAKQQMVAYWKKTGIVSDAGMCAAIEQVTGVRCEELNPHEDWITLRAVLCAPGRITGGAGRKTKEMRERAA